MWLDNVLFYWSKILSCRKYSLALVFLVFPVICIEVQHRICGSVALIISLFPLFFLLVHSLLIIHNYRHLHNWRMIIIRLLLFVNTFSCFLYHSILSRCFSPTKYRFQKTLEWVSSTSFGWHLNIWTCSQSVLGLPVSQNTFPQFSWWSLLSRFMKW